VSLTIVDFTIVAAAKGERKPYTTAGDAAKAAEAAASSTTTATTSRPAALNRNRTRGAVHQWVESKPYPTFTAPQRSSSVLRNVV